MNERKTEQRMMQLARDSYELAGKMTGTQALCWSALENADLDREGLQALHAWALQQVSEMRELASAVIADLRVARMDETLTQPQREQMDEMLGTLIVELANLDGAQVLGEFTEAEVN